MRQAFTLIELMLVMAIMGILGTISIGGFRAMRRGMEERAVMQNVDAFMESARQRAVIDRLPVAVYFWNETRRAESDSESILVVGRAVAVRRAGRISKIEGNYLIDEFGDFRYSAGSDEEGDEESDDSQATGNGAIQVRLYRMNGSESGDQDANSSLVSQTTANMQEKMTISQMMTDPDWAESHSGDDAKVLAYGYYTDDPSKWKVGYAYGFEFAEITLPNNYIFGSSFSEDTKDPIRAGASPLHIDPGSVSSASSVQVYAIRPGSDGAPKAESVDKDYE